MLDRVRAESRRIAVRRRTLAFEPQATDVARVEYVHLATVVFVHQAPHVQRFLDIWLDIPKASREVCVGLPVCHRGVAISCTFAAVARNFAPLSSLDRELER